MEEGALLCLLCLISVLSSNTNQAHLIVKPSQSQFFTGSSVSLICQYGGSAGWTLKRKTSRQTRVGCGDGWGEAVGSVCTINSMSQRDSGSYWCESSDGSSSSSSINLTVSDGAVMLQTPVLPVMEGDDVTLTCRTNTPSSKPQADFYKDGSHIRQEPAGYMILRRISRSDEGQYRCDMSGNQQSQTIWISVRGKPTKPPPVIVPKPGSSFTTPAPPLPPSGSPSLLLFLLPPVCAVVLLALLVLLVLLVRRCVRRKRQGNDAAAGDKRKKRTITQKNHSKTKQKVCRCQQKTETRGGQLHTKNHQTQKKSRAHMSSPPHQSKP
ncbi:uncharacterized protein KZ484_003230 [Pholidichthys leucotaenia]